MIIFYFSSLFLSSRPHFHLSLHKMSFLKKIFAIIITFTHSLFHSMLKTLLFTVLCLIDVCRCCLFRSQMLPTKAMQQDQMQTVLKDTIVLLCQNGLRFQSEFKLEALVAVTVDQSEVLLVSIKETVHAQNTDGLWSRVIYNVSL